jgi:hypothetical protein
VVLAVPTAAAAFAAAAVARFDIKRAQEINSCERSLACPNPPPLFAIPLLKLCIMAGGAHLAAGSALLPSSYSLREKAGVVLRRDDDQDFFTLELSFRSMQVGFAITKDECVCECHHPS